MGVEMQTLINKTAGVQTIPAVLVSSVPRNGVHTGNARNRWNKPFFNPK